MGYVIAMAGKGGTGKTTLAALIVRIIKDKKLGSILAVDADPNSNLAEALGAQVQATIGQILDKIAASPQAIPSGMPKDRFIEYEVQTAIAEAEGFDVLTMGKPEGPGCYCYVNNVLRDVMSKLIKDYDYIVIDNEAGLEHLSRRTTRQADALVVVSDANKVGLKSAERINMLAQELEIKIKKRLLIINREVNPIDRQMLKDTSLAPSLKGIGRAIPVGLEYLGNIPSDENIIKISANGNSLFGLNDNSVSLEALRRIGEKIWL